MTTCRYDTETGGYVLPDGEGCDVPKRDHCHHRRSCGAHLGWGEITCARCYGRVRSDIRQIVLLMTTMGAEAEQRGTVDTEPAMLAGPAGDPLVLQWRRITLAQKTGGYQASSVGADDDDPTAVLGIWQAMLSEDYDDELPDRITLTSAAAYLERHLNKVAQDEEQDFALMAAEIRRCRKRLESVLRDSQEPERGAPCPICTEERAVVRLVREYGHYCDEEGCTRVNYDTDEADAWRCPKNPAHTWTVQEYENWVEERMGA